MTIAWQRQEISTALNRKDITTSFNSAGLAMSIARSDLKTSIDTQLCLLTMNRSLGYEIVVIEG